MTQVLSKKPLSLTLLGATAASLALVSFSVVKFDSLNINATIHQGGEGPALSAPVPQVAAPVVPPAPPAPVASATPTALPPAQTAPVRVATPAKEAPPAIAKPAPQKPVVASVAPTPPASKPQARREVARAAAPRTDMPREEPDSVLPTPGDVPPETGPLVVIRQELPMRVGGPAKLGETYPIRAAGHGIISR